MRSTVNCGPGNSIFGPGNLVEIEASETNCAAMRLPMGKSFYFKIVFSHVREIDLSTSEVAF